MGIYFCKVFCYYRGRSMKRNTLKYIIWFVTCIVSCVLLYIFGFNPDIFVWLAIWVTIVLVEYICNHSDFD